LEIAVRRTFVERRRTSLFAEGVIPIGVALSEERELPRILEMILVESQRLASADGATLYMKRAGVLDFMDLLLIARDLVRDRAAVRAELQHRMSHIFVDEFQDTDPLQAEILLLLAAADPAESDWRRARPLNGKLFIVGDPKQSIYRFRRADVALYRAKNEGRSRACIYDANMDADLRERKQLEVDLRTAIKEDGLSVAYQPIMNANGEKMIGVEALCRWNHPLRGNVPPTDFIPIAEGSELIIPLGEWVLRKACLEAKPWTGLTVAVNVSPLQFRRQDFAEVIERILAETGIDPHRVELELTESTLLGNVEDAEKAMHRLKALGVRFALDDFGTGYSSLLYLRSFPFDRIKIDRSFVRSIESAADAASIVHAIVSLGRGLGMKVTAEGVETAEQQLFLRAAGVHSLQGFRFGKPAPAESIADRLQQATFTPMQVAAS